MSANFDRIPCFYPFFFFQVRLYFNVKSLLRGSCLTNSLIRAIFLKSSIIFLSSVRRGTLWKEGILAMRFPLFFIQLFGFQCFIIFVVWLIFDCKNLTTYCCFYDFFVLSVWFIVVWFCFSDRSYKEKFELQEGWVNGSRTK